MNQFEGFPRRTVFSAVPELFFSQVMPSITDIDELKATLAFFRLLTHKKGSPRYVRFSELGSDPALTGSLGSDDSGKALKEALDKACRRGTLLKINVSDASATDVAYLMNTESDRESAAKVADGSLVLPGLEARPTETIALDRPNIYTNYEKNIGLITPIIADELKDAQKNYPEEWINDAIKEAANHNKRSWSYISAILERWSSEGKNGGAHRGRPEADPDKYIKGKYGHMVQR